jgi:hypothetical protein
MTSLFDVIDFGERNDRTASRRALALAHKKVGERFDTFLNQRVASADYTARMELIKDDFRDTIREACESIGYTDVDGIVHTLWNERLVHATSSRTASAEGDGFDKEARRPKLCPYHSEVVDASLAAGDPQAGYHAYAQHAWTGKHCKGDEYDGGRCSFKPEMTTATYWDEKKEQAEQRRQEREERAQEAQDYEKPTVTEDEVEPQSVEDETPVAEDADFEVVDVEPAGGEATEPQAGLAQEELMAVAASAGRFRPLAAGPLDPRDPASLGQQTAPQAAPQGVPPQQAPQAPSVPPQQIPGQPAAQPVPLPPQQVPGQGQFPGGQLPGHPLTQDPTQLQQQPLASTKQAEAVERQKVTDVPESLPAGSEKHRWRTNLKPVDSEGEGSPHPTRRKDPAPSVDQEKPSNKQEVTEIGEQVTEHQDVTQDSEFQGSKANDKTWPTRSPSAVDS